MNREEVLNTFLLANIPGIITQEEFNDVKKAIKHLLQENKELKEHIEKYEHYCKTTGIEELMKENKKYKEVIDKAIEYIEKCLKQTPTENRTKTDDTLDIEYEYILKILKEVE